MSKDDALLGKAHRYLSEGRVRVVTAGGGMADVLVTGSADAPYAVSLAHGVWSCTCPARVAVCSHIMAAALVCDPTGERLATAVAPEGRAPDGEGRVRAGELRAGDRARFGGSDTVLRLTRHPAPSGRHLRVYYWGAGGREASLYVRPDDVVRLVAAEDA